MKKMTAGAAGGMGRLQKAGIGYAKGGKVHDDAAMDKKLIKAEMAKKGMKRGGKVGKMKGC